MRSCSEPMSARCPSSVMAHNRITLPDAKAIILVSEAEFWLWFWLPLIRAFKAARSIGDSMYGLVKTSCQPPASLNL